MAPALGKWARENPKPLKPWGKRWIPKGWPDTEVYNRVATILTEEKHWNASWQIEWLLEPRLDGNRNALGWAFFVWSPWVKDRGEPEVTVDQREVDIHPGLVAVMQKIWLPYEEDGFFCVQVKIRKLDPLEELARMNPAIPELPPWPVPEKSIQRIKPVEPKVWGWHLDILDILDGKSYKWRPGLRDPDRGTFNVQGALRKKPIAYRETEGADGHTYAWRMYEMLETVGRRRMKMRVGYNVIVTETTLDPLVLLARLGKKS